MKKLKFPISKLVLTATLFFAALAFQPVQAQITFDDDVDDSTSPVPIDGLLGLGLAAGALYGIRKLKGKK
tara:strand:- start:62 stop:271 length:210 start_codon:yes stop_codon:yes gene_type:complete